MNPMFDQERILGIAQRSKQTPTYCGELHRYIGNLKRTTKYYTLYQNLLFEFEAEKSQKPSMVILLEHCYAYRMEINDILDMESQKIFYISERKLSLKFNKTDQLYHAKDENDCMCWIKHINDSSYCTLKSTKEELEYRNMHLVRAIESERTAKWKLQECAEEQKRQLQSLRKEIPALISKKVDEALKNHEEVEDEELKRIKKIQSFIRGVLCRRRWHAIVQDYIRSPHAESMRTRNRIVFQLVRSEEEYVECLSTLISVFYRPCKMAASSKHQAITHDEVNSIFLNSETLMFLHQIFLKGLLTRMDNWPKLLLGDLFDMLLPMLSIYQEYVRNHHYSLQTLTECKQKEAFRKLLTALESKEITCGRTLDMFLTYPMHRIPTYIATLQKLLALTPFDHIERKSLEHSQSALEELSTVIHDEVSETENIRKNLAIERLFVEGCERLLDVSEVFIRQGILLQINLEPNTKVMRKKSVERRECVRQCFLFSRLLIMTSRMSGGKLQLTSAGKINLAQITLIEDIVDEDIAFCRVPYSQQSNLAFKLLVKDEEKATVNKLILMAATMADKISWTSDINQCIENLKEPEQNQTISIESRRSLISIRSDPRLFTDSDDIKYSRALDSCRLPRIRYASVQRLLERLMDVRFMSVEYLNAFLTTHSVFTTTQIVLDTIFEFYHARKPIRPLSIEDPEPNELPGDKGKWASTPEGLDQYRDHARTMSSISSAESVQFPAITRTSQTLQLPQVMNARRHSSPPSMLEGIGEFLQRKSQLSLSSNPEIEMLQSLSNQNHSPVFYVQEPTYGDASYRRERLILTSPPRSRKEMNLNKIKKSETVKHAKTEIKEVSNHSSGKASEEKLRKKTRKTMHRASLPTEHILSCRKDHMAVKPASSTKKEEEKKESGKQKRSQQDVEKNVFDLERPEKDLDLNSFSSEFQRSPRTPPTPGVIVTSFKESQRRSSIIDAAVAFAAATAGATISPVASPTARFRFKYNFRFSEDYDGNVVTKRVLVILRHWILKQPENIAESVEWKTQTEQFLQEVIQAEDTVACERKVANSILKELTVYELKKNKSPIYRDLPKPKDFNSIMDSISTQQFAEQITFIDHTLLSEVPVSEFLSTAWMRPEKTECAAHLLKAIERFNLTSRLIAGEIVLNPTPSARAMAIEQWSMIADACRCLHNFNGVLTIMTAFTSSAIFRLRKSWEKVSKQTKQMIEKLKNMVSAEGRFRNMRQALKCCDPPCVPYLGFYLADLAFIEERSSLVKDTELVNFSKMKMVANVIEEIRSYQKVKYKLEPNNKVLAYLYQTGSKLSEEDIYQLSLEAEPKRATPNSRGLKFSFHFGGN